jgi:PKD repeat protein
LGSAGRDNDFGYGLVRAKTAVDYLDANGCSGGDGGGGDTNTAPTAAFTFACTDLACDFDASGSTDSDGSIAAYDWDFGDGNTGTGELASHTYASGADYTVTLTVTDDAGATDSTSQTVSVSSGDTGGSGIDLSATGYKVKGRHHADLTWSGASTSQVDVYRNGSLEATVSNSGAWTWSSNIRGGNSHTFEVCEAGSNVCSASVTVSP